MASVAVFLPAIKAEPDHPDIMAKPLHVQQLEKALDLAPLLSYVQGVLDRHGHGEVSSEEEGTAENAGSFPSHNGVHVSKSERRADKARFYNLSHVKKGRKWLKNLLLSDSSSDDETENEITVTEADIQAMLRNHVREKRTRSRYYGDTEQYAYYSSGLLSQYDKYSEKSVLASKAKREQRKRQRKLIKVRARQQQEEDSDSDDDIPIKTDYVQFRSLALNTQPGAVGRPSKRDKKLTIEQLTLKRRKVFTAIAKKEIPKAHKQMASSRKDMLTQLKKVAKESQKEARKGALLSQKISREAQIRARRLSKEMMVYWKRFEKVEKEQRRRAEKEAQAQRREDHELKEMKRQQRKLNFLITQTELYAHFMARKMTGEGDEGEDGILGRLNETHEGKAVEANSGLVDITHDDYDVDEARARARENAQRAFNKHQEHKRAFDHVTVSHDSGLANPALSTDTERPQPSIFEGKLKGYQMKGMNWLANLYDQGINGILADEMGLGKTVQSIALLAHLAEAQGIWGPFLIIAPASTLHNWQQELTKFLPKFKVVPYWGNTQDRRVLRKFWNSDSAYSEDASFHVVITSYQLVIQDVKYFSRIKWHYMILDEAQAIKSTTSVRWKILLGFNCRNRLLLTGTPIQNTMQELWALLHFIMPTMFDSHEEFNEWFSKDIESHAEKQSGIDEKHLSRLHMILKPFMLRRCKTEVENELSDKIEVLVYCPLTARQRLLYQAVKNKIRIEDLLQSGGVASGNTSSLMNLVMQFRKVCNHPELFERKEVRSPFYMRLPAYRIPRILYANLLSHALPSKRHVLYNKLYIHDPHHVHSSIFQEPREVGDKEGIAYRTRDLGDNTCCFSFTRLTNMSPAELHAFMFKGLLVRWLNIFKLASDAFRTHHDVTWRSGSDVTHRQLLLTPLHTTHFTNVYSSQHLQKLVFTCPRSSFHAHLPWTVHCVPETPAHRKIRMRAQLGKELGHHKKPKSPHKLPGKLGHDEEAGFVFPHVTRPPVTYDDVSTDVPAFLYHTMPKVMGCPFTSYTSSRSAAWRALADKCCGDIRALHALTHGTHDLFQENRNREFKPRPRQGLDAIKPKYGYSGVYVPDKETLIRDAGKLDVLDTLLGRLKSEGHRVLIYSQMTRMIDILEEYMWHRKHSFIRLDGSSKISERRDMVADFQNKTEIFVFLLSTRAGGLGINLTAADTVIFYDSDWNPTVDQQAMDRAHRLGQTKQVTVYRLICKGTIEERILQRAKEKSEIQKMVISGGDYRPDVLRPKEVVSLLLDDDEMEEKFVQRSDEDRLLGNRPHFSMGIKRRTASIPGKKGPGRPKKKREENLTIAEDSSTTPGMLTPSHSTSMLDEYSMDSVPPSPYSMASQESVDDISIDDATPPPKPSSKGSTPSSSSGRGGSGKKRGRPKGSVSGSRRPRGRGSIQKALHAAEAAAAQVGLSKGYAAYGYVQASSSSTGNTGPSSVTSGSGSPARMTSPRGRGRPPSRQGFSPKRPAKTNPKTPPSLS